MKNTVIVNVVAAVISVAAAAGAAEAPRKEMPPRKIMRGPVVWRIFSQLDETERKKLHELQRSDPEKFAAEMQKLAEKYEANEKEWRNKMHSLIGQFHRSTDKNEREKIKNEIFKMESVRFRQRLDGLERTIATNKRRVALMEQELKKRRERSGAIVEARVEAILSGEIPLNTSDAPPFHPRKNPRFRRLQ